MDDGAHLDFSALDGCGGMPVHQRMLEFARELRANEFVIGSGDVAEAASALSGIDLLDREEAHWVLRSVFCSNIRDWSKFEKIFHNFWLRHDVPSTVVAGESASGASKIMDVPNKPDPKGAFADLLESLAPGDGDEGAEASGTGRSEGASSAENTETADLAHLADVDELEKVRELAGRLSKKIRYRRARRYRFGPKGKRPDLRRTMQKSVSSGGTPIKLYRRERREKPFKLIVLLDVSGSMDLHSTFFLRFMHAVLAEFEQAEAFAFHTRLVQLSTVLMERDPEKFADRLTLLAQGWSGGTKIGECLADFNAQYAKSILTSRSMVIIVSDGFDTGEPEHLAQEMAALKRRSKRLIWLNPLIGQNGYEPKAGGMAAALPHVDLFASAHDVESLAALENELARM
jgi:uncharacterized protein with von Willebrand factor type A (vWA) domain